MEFEAVVNTALQYNPNDRFSSTAAMKDALLNVARKTGTLDKVAAALPVSSGGVKPLWTFKCVAPAGSAEFSAKAPKNLVTSQPFAHMAHEIFNEPDREKAMAPLGPWLKQVFGT